MKTHIFLGALLAVAASAPRAFAQPPDPVQRAEPIVKREYVLDIPVVSSAEAQKLALPDDIQIHLRDVTLLAALQELEKQSGLPFDLSALDAKKLEAKISVDIDTPAVIRALDAIAAAANLSLDFTHSPSWDTWHIRENKAKKTPRLAPESVDGLFAARLFKVDVSLFKQLDLDAAKPVRTQDDNLNLTLELTPDPGLPLGGLPVLRATRAEDDKGRSLVRPADAPEKVNSDAGFLDIWSKKTVTLKLLPPAADARRIQFLEGEALYMVAVKRARWEVPNLLENDRTDYNFKIGEVEVKTKLSEAKIDGENVRLRLEMTLPPGASWQKFSGNLYSVYGVLKWMTVTDDNGTRLIPRGGGGNNSNNVFSSYANFVMPPGLQGQKEKPKLKLPIQFIFEPPTEWVQAQTKFKFEDVPLP